VDRPSQEPPERTGPPSGAGESPLSFPVEAPKLTGVEPGTGAPSSFPAEVTPAFPPEVSPPAEPLPFPVAELPGIAAAPRPDPVAEPEPEPVEAAGPAPSERLRVLPPVLTALAALMALGGCFLPLFRMFQQLNIRQGLYEARLSITETAWGSRIEIPGQEATDRPGVPVGIPVVVAVVVLAVAAFMAFSRPDRGLSRWLVSAGAVFTAGVVTTIGMGRLELAAIAGEEVDLEVTTGLGMWLLVLATVLAAAAAVVAHLPARPGATAGWADPAVAYADTPTPPSGVAITLLPPDDDEQHR
jgi:hypothetical protein